MCRDPYQRSACQLHPDGSTYGFQLYFRAPPWPTRVRARGHPLKGGSCTWCVCERVCVRVCHQEATGCLPKDGVRLFHRLIHRKRAAKASHRTGWTIGADGACVLGCGCSNREQRCGNPAPPPLPLAVVLLTFGFGLVVSKTAFSLLYPQKITPPRSFIPPRPDVSPLLYHPL